jgi:CHAD domain-containing protein
MQAGLLSQFRAWERSDVFPAVEGFLRQLADAQGQRGEKRVFRVAKRVTLKSLKNLLRREKLLDRPERVKELHEVRIAAKDLRYRLEIFYAYYGEGLKPFVSAVKTLQAHLGDIHDFDVRIGLFPQFLTEYSQDDQLQTVVRRLETFCRSRRKRAYDKLLKTWGKYREDALWVQLKECMAQRPL